MAAYVFANNGLPIFDPTGSFVKLNSAGQPVDHIRYVVTITTAKGLKNNGYSRQTATPQPSMPIQVATPVYSVTTQAVKTFQACTVTPKFTCAPRRINRNLFY